MPCSFPVFAWKLNKSSIKLGPADFYVALLDVIVAFVTVFMLHSNVVLSCLKKKKKMEKIAIWLCVRI